MRCCVLNCPNSKRNLVGVSSFSIPKSDIRDSWIKVLNLDPQSIDLKARVCMRHFTEDDVFHFASITRLKPKRVPSINLGCEEPIENIQTQNNTIKTESTHCNNSLDSKVAIIRRSHFRPRLSNFCIENFRNKDNKIFYYSGMPNYKTIRSLFKLIIESKDPIKSEKKYLTITKITKKHKLSPMNEMFLTLMKLRRDLEYEFLADIFLISKSAVSRIFITWINLLYIGLTKTNVFPHRDVLFSMSSPKFYVKYPNAIGSLVFIECNVEAMKKALNYTQYKETKTLKGLIIIAPNSSIIFNSYLFPDSMTNQEIIQESGLYLLLMTKIEVKELCKEDKILVDRELNIGEFLENADSVDIPIFKIYNNNNESEEQTTIKAHKRIHEDKAFRKLKTFNMLVNRIPITRLHNVNQLFTVCALLSNFVEKTVGETMV